MKKYLLAKHILAVIVIGLLLGIQNDIYAYQDIEQLKSLSKSFVDIAKKVQPAVVLITSTRKAERRRSRSDSFFNRRNRQEQPSGRPSIALGSGVIVDPSGYIITNNHVVENSIKLEVQLTNKFKYEAELIGNDPLTDLALIKIKGRNFPYLKLGDSDKLEVGEWVIAVGSPNGLTSTVTHGIVSAMGRPVNVLGGQNYRIENFIQTDAAINSGNSGGPLLNLDGDIIGINTAILSGSGGFQGYGFAVPSNLVKNTVDDLRKYGKVLRGVIGVTLADIEDQNQMKEYRLPSTDGVRISGFSPEINAGRMSGLKVNDVVVAIDGKEITRYNQLQTIVSGKKPGDTINLKVLRMGVTKYFSVTLEGMPDQPVMEQPEIPTSLPEPNDNYKEFDDFMDEFGKDIRERDDENVRRYLDNLNKRDFEYPNLGLNVERIRLSEKSPAGVKVSSVLEGSPADKKEIKEGDVIFKIDTIEINNKRDFDRAMSRYGDGRFVTFYTRNEEGNTSIVALRFRNK